MINKKILVLISFCFLSNIYDIFSADNINNKPRVSIITSIYNGEKFMEGFLEDITRQTIFPECELLLINADSPENEESIIAPYLKKYPNIIYIKLDKDPGLYGVWNYGIKKATSDFIANANLDDRHAPDCLERQAQALEEDPSVDLVYSDRRLTYNPNETFENSKYRFNAIIPEFLPSRMNLCLAGPQPLWRKSMHTKYGYFDESYTSSGDHEMWNRAVSGGAKLKKISGISGIIYINPDGISTDANPEKTKKRFEEDMLIQKIYGHLWH